MLLVRLKSVVSEAVDLALRSNNDIQLRQTDTNKLSFLKGTAAAWALFELGSAMECSCMRMDLLKPFGNYLQLREVTVRRNARVAASDLSHCTSCSARDRLCNATEALPTEGGGDES